MGTYCSVCRYLVIGGGGGGAFGGGGAGGFVEGFFDTALDPGIAIPIYIGSGGSFSNGDDSSIGDIVAFGGGAGGDSLGGNLGGSGGGGDLFYPGGDSINYQGHKGADGHYFVDADEGCSGGGGGAGAPGGDGDNACSSSNRGRSNGGDGLQSDITGQRLWYAGGGGGVSTFNTTIYGESGLGGGSLHYGGGGNAFQHGGSGVVILSHLITNSTYPYDIRVIPPADLSVDVDGYRVFTITEPSTIGLGCKANGTGYNITTRLCDACPIGTYGTGIECAPCVPGTYSNTTGSSTCKECPDGYYSPIPGQKECQKCPTGYISAGGYCSIGHFLIIGGGGTGMEFGAGGGAGGFVEGYFNASFDVGASMLAQVGAGGLRNVNNNSGTDTSLGEIIAHGGGAGGDERDGRGSGRPGGSGGGAMHFYPGNVTCSINHLFFFYRQQFDALRKGSFN